MGRERPSLDSSADLAGLSDATTEHAPLPMATLEGATHIVRYVNRAFCHLLNESAAHLVGKRFHELLPEKDECTAVVERVFRTGKPETHTEQKYSESHPFFWSYTVWPVMAAEETVGVVVLVTETTQTQ